MASKNIKGKEQIVMEAGESSQKKVQNSLPLVIDNEDSKHILKKSKVDDSDGNKDKAKSAVWDWFTKFKDSEGKDKAKCKHCSKIYAADPRKNGTSALRAHMLTLCRFRVKKNNQKMLSFSEKKKDGITVGALKAIKFDEEQCRVALVKMVVVDELFFKFVENEGFRNYSNQLEPRFKVPSRTTIFKYCINLFISEKKKLKKQLRSERMCLTTDTWTSIQKYGYMCLTGHWIDKEWRLQKRILNFVRIIDHTGEGIGNEILNCMADWEIKKNFTITMDNASVNDVVARFLTRKTKEWKSTILENEFLQVRCSAHILNLIVKEGLSEYNESIEKIRLAIKFVKGSSQRLEKFKKCVVNAEILSKALLCLDVDTRWNSTFLMLETAIKFEKAFNELEDESSYRSYFHNADSVNGTPKAEDWNNASLFVKLLKLFYTVTLEVSGTKYPTSHLFFQNISMMEHAINSMCDSQDSAMSIVAHRMKTKFDKYWGSLEKSNILLYVAFVLDPQCKLKRLAKCFKAVYDIARARTMIELTERTLYRLYSHYDAIVNATPTQHNISQASSSGTSMNQDDVEYNFIAYQKKMFMDDFEEDEATICVSEITMYLKEDTLKLQTNFDILNWWKLNCSRFPILSQVAREVLAIPISTVASESAFSTGGRIFDPFRSSLLPKTVEDLICAHDWLRCKTNFSEIEEMIVDVEKYEELDKELDKQLQEGDIGDVKIEDVN